MTDEAHGAEAAGKSTAPEAARAIDAFAERVRPHYARFLAQLDSQALLTAHSHQAWPDVSREGQLEAWDDAARLIDGKWDRVFGEILPEFQRGVGERLGTERFADIAIAPNSHELAYRLLSCFGDKPRVVTTDGEFHSLSRQLDRLEEDGAPVTRVAAEPTPGDDSTFADRFIAALEAERPDLAATSHVLFGSGRILDGIDHIARAADRLGIPLLVDAYHSFGAVPLAVDTWPGQVFVTAGGYKYAQAGEGTCFMLLPADSSAYRPRQTGWFADFGSLSDKGSGVGYGPGGMRFFGATFDPSGLYRAVHTWRFKAREGLDVPALREQSLRQTEYLIAAYDRASLSNLGCTLVSPRVQSERGGFVTISHPDAGQLVTALASRNVRIDARKDRMRFGPAPYTRSVELDRGIGVLTELLRAS